MNEVWQVSIWAALMGMITAVHPCPFSMLTIASGMFVNLGRVIRRAVLFSVGIVVTFTVLGALLGGTLSLIPGVSHVLPRLFKPFVGPVIILVAMLQAGLIRWPERWTFHAATSIWKDKGMVGCFLGGALVALAFCPATAGIFFVLVVPASATTQPAVISAAYGLGFALVPITLITGLRLGFGTLDRNRSKRLGKRVSDIVAYALIIAGVVITLMYTFHVRLQGL